ncbi:type II toxin-antitoxin system RelE/ParE family toxin [Levilactobacillus fuyuanensis]|uniref:Type II toxin-antitoxin system RelE/ParE family toxin n=1 Tax=Levilactobacillus fuyuanensis TaxID=2486022 RepID=A0ABW4H4H6_9LACO|nr:killer suppression protein [Levilactobacillus fuyuanensis]
MEIRFEQGRLEKHFKSMAALTGHFGPKEAINLGKRIKELEAADDLSQIAYVPPPRLHALTGNRKGCFAVAVTANMRLVFRGLDRFGGPCVVKTEVVGIVIKEVVDYHAS